MPTTKPVRQTATQVLPPATCRFYKELDVILGGDPTTMDTSEWGEEEESGSEGAGAGGDSPESLEACSQELFLSQEKDGRSDWLLLVGGQTEEQVPDATLRSQLSVLSPAERLQKLRKRPRKSKEDRLQEVMHQSLKENQKVQEWRESESRIRLENAAHRWRSTEHWQQSTDQLISIMEHQADSIHALVAMQVEQYCACPPSPAALVPKLLCPHVTSNPLSPTSVFLPPPAASNTCIFTT
ncbi:uncharacterized protein LOC128839109 [Malaclemys terrapin pileata]|uniref:uncharacterized protein LOC128839109 n=1 Tax=Malaclemys terrapin pileata TaxID=2991368 RepID=UPI0023A8894E|nr:uncharacterized protein LOC128839109 [Malaclemys terrapin pileata]